MIALRIDNQVHLSPLSELAGQVATQVRDRLTFPNPAYQEAEKRGFSTWNIPQEIKGYQVDGDRLTMPRGFTRQLVGILRGAGIRFTIEDHRRTLAPVDFDFKGTLKDFQEEAVEAMAARDLGTLAAPTGSGKTVMALALIAMRRQPALIVVHTRELLDQWIDRIGAFLGIPAGEVGIIGNGKKRIGHKITVALVQSLYKCAGEVAPFIGHLIVDECFVGGTAVDTPTGPRPIEEINSGDSVLGYDHDTKKVVITQALHKFHRQSNNLYRVLLENGQRIECTANHPLYVGDKYVPTCQLKSGDYVWRVKNDPKTLQRVRAREDEYRLFLPGMQGDEERGAQKGGDFSLLCVWPACRVPRFNPVAQLSCTSKSGAGNMLAGMHAGGEASSPDQERRVPGTIQSNERTLAQGRKQPNEEAGECCKDDCHEKEERDLITATDRTGRQWAGHASSAKAIGRCPEMAGRSPYQNLHSYSERQAQSIPVGPQVTPMLQDRHCQPRIDGRGRGGRRKSQWEQAVPGRKEDGMLTKIRVEAVTPVESTDTERSCGLCADRDVYNLETGTENYFAGGVLVHNCHRAPSRIFTECVTAFDSRFTLGLSATPWRRDGLSRLIYWYIGDKVHEVDKAALVDAGHVLAADVIWRETSFRPFHDPSAEYSKMLSELTQDPARNGLIASDVAREAGNGGGVCLVLSDRKAHCDTLAAFLADWGIEAAVLTGDLSNGARQAVVEALSAGKIKVLVATGQLIGEGFDCRELSTLFLATPIKFNGRLLQYLGRVLRPAPGKDRARVYDYVDPVGVLECAAKARQRVYDRQ